MHADLARRPIGWAGSLGGAHRGTHRLRGRRVLRSRSIRRPLHRPARPSAPAGLLVGVTRVRSSLWSTLDQRDPRSDLQRLRNQCRLLAARSPTCPSSISRRQHGAPRNRDRRTHEALARRTVGGSGDGGSRRWQRRAARDPRRCEHSDTRDGDRADRGSNPRRCDRPGEQLPCRGRYRHRPDPHRGATEHTDGDHLSGPTGVLSAMAP